MKVFEYTNCMRTVCFWYRRLTQVNLDLGPLNELVCRLLIIIITVNYWDQRAASGNNLHAYKQEIVLAECWVGSQLHVRLVIPRPQWDWLGSPDPQLHRLRKLEMGLHMFGSVWILPVLGFVSVRIWFS